MHFIPALFCYGDEENARIYAVHLTTANQSEIRRNARLRQSEQVCRGFPFVVDCSPREYKNPVNEWSICPCLE